MAVREVAANVLVVDDQPAIRAFMSDALGAFGYQVGAAGDADQAFELVARNRFDLVISDLRLPGVAGLDFVARLRAIDAALPVIMLTGSGPLDEELRRVRAAGITVLHKPIQLPLLQRALDAALGGPRRMNTDTAVVDFREARGGNVWGIEVIVDGLVSGHIYDGNGSYRYFEGPHNDITWSFAEPDLERLKVRIRATVRAERRLGRPSAV